MRVIKYTIGGFRNTLKKWVERRNNGGHNEKQWLSGVDSFSCSPILNPQRVSFSVHGKDSEFLFISAPSLYLRCVRGAGGLRRVIASLCPCTSSSVWTPGLWKGPGPASSESGPAACCQTSWQTCSCRSDVEQSGLGRPSEMPGSSEREKQHQMNYEFNITLTFQASWAADSHHGRK